ncbi:MAG: hypothetical protein RLO52_08135 [Sandaracinaceae bacterium]
MGTYTQIYQSTRAVAAQRRGLRIDSAHGAVDREQGSFPFSCPTCGEGAVVQTTCFRCDVDMRPAGKSVQIPRPAAQDETRRSAGMAALGLGVAFGVPAVLFAATTSIDAQLGSLMHATERGAGMWALALVAPAALAVALLLLASWLPRVRRRARWLAGLRSARRVLGSTPSVAPSAAPDHAEAAVRVRGRVRVVDGALHVYDGDAYVRVPLSTRVRVISADDQPCFVLSDGEEVEVLGRGGRGLGAGEGYRDVLGPFTFDGASPVQIYVR